jgi:hypothetical protein
MPFWLWFSYIPLCHDITPLNQPPKTKKKKNEIKKHLSTPHSLFAPCAIRIHYPRWTGLGLALGSFYLSFFMPFWLWFSYIPLCHEPPKTKKKEWNQKTPQHAAFAICALRDSNSQIRICEFESRKAQIANAACWGVFWFHSFFFVLGGWFTQTNDAAISVTHSVCQLGINHVLGLCVSPWNHKVF